MNAIETLKSKLRELAESTSAVKSELQVEYNKVFDDSKMLRDDIAAVQASNTYEFDRYGEIVAWHRLYELKEFHDCKEYLEAWLGQECIQVDWDQECLFYRLGGCIVINEDGDVYCTDSGNFIVDSAEYTIDGEVDTAKRDALIEAYMERVGEFPGVFRTDRHGNVFPVNTQAKVEV
jgi:hypothetical protein